jgi:hypothetical protein
MCLLRVGRVIESHFLSLVTSETYCHPHFQRNRRHICQFVTRKKEPSKAKDKNKTGAKSHKKTKTASDFCKVERRFEDMPSSFFETPFGQHHVNDSDGCLEGIEKQLLKIPSGEKNESPSKWIQHHRTALLESGFEFIGGSSNKRSCSSSLFSADEIVDELISTFQEEQDEVEAA